MKQEDKLIAKDILIKALEQGYVIRDEFPATDTAVDAICKAYEKILTTVVVSKGN